MLNTTTGQVYRDAFDGYDGKRFCRDGEAVVKGAAEVVDGGGSLDVWLGLWVDEKTPTVEGAMWPPAPKRNGDGTDDDVKAYLASEAVWGEERELVRLLNEHRDDFAKVVKAVIVGSEALFRGDQTLDATIKRLRRIRNILELYGFTTDPTRQDRVIVTAADLAGPYYPDELIREVDLVLVNVYPYWEHISVQDATSHQFLLHDSMQSRVHQLHAAGLLRGTRPLGVGSAQGGEDVPVQVAFGEVGWPSAGDVLGAAIPSLPNLNIALNAWMCEAKTKNVGYFWFEFCDEKWKPEWHGAVEQNWGIYDARRHVKIGVLSDGGCAAT
ncbi:glycoside hydrolase superfamily [Chytridium lagenaria]|nr:glycoside hydrolase superfamily [Chytridium lagenaria]